MTFKLLHPGVIHNPVKLCLNLLHLDVIKELDGVHAVQDPLLVALVLVNDVVDFVILVIVLVLVIILLGRGHRPEEVHALL